MFCSVYILCECSGHKSPVVRSILETETESALSTSKAGDMVLGQRRSPLHSLPLACTPLPLTGLSWISLWTMCLFETSSHLCILLPTASNSFWKQAAVAESAAHRPISILLFLLHQQNLQALTEHTAGQVIIMFPSFPRPCD